MIRKIQWARILTAIAIALFAADVRAEQPEKPPKGMGKYLVVLWDPGTPIPGKKDERMKRVAEPDIEKLGGRVLASKANRRMVFLPYAAAKQLRRHQAVSYVQRLWTGEPFSEWNETDADVALRATEVSTDADPTFTWDKSYSYDGDGNITHIGSDEFAYDDMGRLTEATVNGAPETYSYDSFGNLTGIGTPHGGVAVATDPASNRMAGETYDAAGNVTSRKDRGTYVYDSLNMLTEYEALPNISRRRMLYDANDERIGTIIDSSLHRWTIRDFEGQILREFKGEDMGLSLIWSWEQDHVRGEGQLLAGEMVTWKYYYDAVSPLTYGGKRHYHLDHLGSVRVVTNQAGRAIAENDFFPFGSARTKQFQEQLNYGDPHTDGMRFAGHWRDFMGHPDVEGNDYIDNMHARHYDPNLGRFLSPDPILGNLLRPQSWNRYAYVLNNPLGYTDPRGMKPCPVIGSDGIEREGECIDVEPPKEEPEEPELALSDEMLRWLDERWHAVDHMRNPITGMTLGEHATASANFAVGFGDASSLGLTALLRDEEDAQNVDSESLAYTAGIVAGTVNSYAYNRAGFTKGYEFTRNPKLFRFAPWGNRTGHRTGRFPHYHLKRPGPGGSIKRHRPWDTRTTDTSFWSRFW